MLTPRTRVQPLPLRGHRGARTALGLLVALTLVSTACGARTSATAERTGSDDPVEPLSLTPAAGTLQTDVEGRGAALAGQTILMVGDSVSVLVAAEVANRVSARLFLDGADCRRIDQAITGPCGGVPRGIAVTDGITALRGLRDHLRGLQITPDAAVVILANNAPVTASLLDEAMTAIDDIPLVLWVNTRIEGVGRQEGNNDELDALAARDDRALVVDWHAASDGQAWLSDNVHPNAAGRAALGTLIADHLACGCVP